jgi:hypothetical protein
MAGVKWASEVTAAIQQGGIPMSLWMGGPGTVSGSVAWTSFVNSMAEYADLTEKFMGNAEVQAKVAGAQDYVLELEVDRMLSIVHGEITEPAPVGAYVGTTRARAVASMGDVGPWSIKIADAFTSATALSALVANTAAGPMAEINWIVRFDDAAAIDTANAAAAGAAGYLDALAEGAGLVTDGIRAYARRIV